MGTGAPRCRDSHTSGETPAGLALWPLAPPTANTWSLSVTDGRQGKGLSQLILEQLGWDGPPPPILPHWGQTPSPLHTTGQGLGSQVGQPGTVLSPILRAGAKPDKMRSLASGGELC